MKWTRTHQGQHRQAISQEEAEAQKDAGLTPGITPDLHAPDISNPADEAEMNLHGDVPGSQFGPPSDEPPDADALAERGTPRADDAATREREAESRRTGVSTEQLAAEDEAEDAAPKPKRSSKK